MFSFSAKNFSKPLWLATSAMMTALYVALYAFKIPLSVESRVTLTFLPLAISGYLMGPVPTMVIAGASDILSCVFFPSGAYFPGFTFSSILTGLIFGVFLFNKKEDKIRMSAILAVLLVIVFVNITLNTLWVSILYQKAFFVFLASRVIKNIIEFPLEVILILICVDALDRTGITKKYR